MNLVLKNKMKEKSFSAVNSPNDKQISLMSYSPYVRNLTLMVIRSIRKKRVTRVREVVHADLVPKFGERIVRQQLGEKTIPARRPVFMPKIISPGRPSNLMPPIMMTPPKAPAGAQVMADDYGRINNLLNDSSVSSIECAGPSKKITIIRYGQVQTTNIELSPKEIKDILEKIADKAHVPLPEGVFRAAVENFSINAVVSEIIGSRFVIKKNTPYNLLEK